MPLSKHNRGHQAAHPLTLPWRGWWDVLRRVFQHLQDDNLSLVAAGVTFYFLLASFPALGALISLYGLFVSPAEVAQHLSGLVTILPAETHELILEQIQRFVSTSDTTLGIGMLSSTLFALWSASKGAQALLIACNITYREQRERSLLLQLAARVIFTAAAIGFILSALAVIALLPILLDQVGLSRYLDWLLTSIFWPVLAMLFHATIAAVYRYGPVRRRARWRWITPGSLLATGMWLLASGLFSFYVANFSSYDETYGSLGGVVILLMWLYLSVFIILLGSELNAALELQTERDTTVGPERAMGERGAFVADNVVRK